MPVSDADLLKQAQQYTAGQQNAPSAEQIAEHVRKTGSNTQGQRIGGGVYPSPLGSGGGGKVQSEVPAAPPTIPSGPGGGGEGAAAYVPFFDPSRGSGLDANSAWDALKSGKLSAEQVLKSVLPNLQEGVSKAWAPVVDPTGTANKAGGAITTDQQRQETLAKYGQAAGSDPTLSTIGNFFRMTPVGRIADLIRTGDAKSDALEQFMASFAASQELAARSPNDPMKIPAALAGTLFNTLQVPAAQTERLIGAADQISGGALSTATNALQAIQPWNIPREAVSVALNATGIAPFVRDNVTNFFDGVEASLTQAIKSSEGKGFFVEGAADTLGSVVQTVIGGIRLAIVGDMSAPASRDMSTGSASNLSQLVAWTSVLNDKILTEMGKNLGWSEEQTARAIAMQQKQSNSVLALVQPDAQKRQQLLDDAVQIQSKAGISSFADLQQKIQAGSFTYESTERMLEAQRRMNAGESWEDVEPSLTSNLSGTEIVTDLVGQLALDPLNLELGGGVKKILNIFGAEKAKRWLSAAQNLGTVVNDTPRSVQLIQRIPGLGKPLAKLFERTAVTNFKLLREETGTFMMQMFKRVNTPEAVLKLKQLGITEHPALVAMKAFARDGVELVPDVVKLADGSTMTGQGVREVLKFADGTTASMDEVINALGYAPTLPTPEMAKQIGFAPGQMIDTWNSTVANNARTFLSESARGGGDFSKIAENWAKADETIKATLKAGTYTDEAGKVLKGADAYQKGVVEPVESLLREFDSAIKKAAGINPNPSKIEKIRSIYGVPQQIMAAVQLSPLNPGNPVRNVLTDSATMFTWHLDFTTPWSTTASEMSDLGLVGAQFGREALGTAPEAFGQGNKGPIRWLYEHSPISKWNTFKEVQRQNSVRLQGFKKFMGNIWTFDKAIPTVSDAKTVGFDVVEAAMRADPQALNQFKYAVEHARTPEALRDIVKGFANRLVVNDPILMKAIDEAGLGGMMDSIIRQASQADNPVEEFQKLVALAINDHAGLTDMAADMSHLSDVDFQVESRVAAAIDSAPLPDEIKAGFRRQFQERLKVLRTHSAQMEAGAWQLLDELKKVNPDDAWAREGKLRQINQAALYDAARGRNDQLLQLAHEAVDTGNGRKLVSQFPELQGLLRPDGSIDAGRLWSQDGYFTLSNTIWMNNFYIPYANQIEAAVADLPDAQKMFGIPFTQRIAGAVPPDAGTRVQLWNSLIDNYRSYGFESQKHFINWLSKDGQFIDADSRVFNPYHIQSQDWYNAVMDGMRQHEADRLAKEADSQRRLRLQKYLNERAKRIENYAGVSAEKAAEQKRATERALSMKEQIALLKKQNAMVDAQSKEGALASVAEKGLGNLDVGPVLEVKNPAEAGLTPGEMLAKKTEALKMREYKLQVDAEQTAEQAAKRAEDISQNMKQYDMLKGRAAQEARARYLLSQVLSAAQDGNVAMGKQFDEATTKAVSGFIDGLIPRMNDTRVLADQVATALQDAVLFNYGDRRNFDTMLSFAFNYPFWHTRNLHSSLFYTLLHDPGALASMVKVRAEMRRINGSKDMPEWWQDNIDLTTVMGGHLHLPILASIDRLNGFFGDKFNDEDMQNTGIGAFLQEVQNYGPGLNANVSIFMALDAYLGRNNRDEALTWMNYMGAPTKGIRATTALLKEAGVPGLPSGGIIPEFWMWNYDSEGRPQMVGNKYDFRRQGVAMSELIREGVITEEQAAEIMRNPEGPLYDQVIQRAERNTATSVIMSWLLGAGVRPRNETEMDVAQMDMERAQLMANKASMTPDEYSAAWKQLSDRYPYMDFIVAFRRDPDERDSLYGWSVMNRLPPSSSSYFTALGYDDQEVNTIGKLLDDFYTRKGDFGEYTDQDGVVHPAMNTGDREMLMTAFSQLGAILAMPSDATQDDWDKARAAYRAMNAALEGQYGEDIQAMQDAYYRTDPEQRQAFLQSHPRLEDYWRAKDNAVVNDPQIAKYYASMELFSRYEWANWRSDMDSKYPGIQLLWDEYDLYKTQGDQTGARKFWAEHPQLANYLHDMNVFQSGLSDRLDAMGGSVTNMEATFATLRQDLPKDVSHAQQSVMDMINAGSRPLGDFSLPPDMDAKKTGADIKLALDNIPPGQYGTVLKELKAMGGLDRTLTAFQEFGNSGGVQANLLETKALYDALRTIFTNHKWDLNAEDPVTNARFSSGGATTGTRLRSTSYGGHGGGGGGGGGKAAGNQLAAYMLDMQKSRPKYWSLLWSMADMTQAEIRALLAQNPDLAAWIDGEIKAGSIRSLNDIRSYFKRTKSPVIKTRKKKA